VPTYVSCLIAVPCSHNSSDEEQDSDEEDEELHGEQQEKQAKQQKTSRACMKKKQKEDQQQVYEENMMAEFSQLIDPAVERAITKRDAAATAAKSAASEKVCLLESIHEYHMQWYMYARIIFGLC
jgi:hypothetical protein